MTSGLTNHRLSLPEPEGRLAAFHEKNALKQFTATTERYFSSADLRRRAPRCPAAFNGTELLLYHSRHRIYNGKDILFSAAATLCFLRSVPAAFVPEKSNYKRAGRCAGWIAAEKIVTLFRDTQGGRHEMDQPWHADGATRVRLRANPVTLFCTTSSGLPKLPSIA